MTDLYRYQRQGLYLLNRFNGRALLADDMGLGKSIQSLCYAERHHLFPVIVICPAALKWNWEREAFKHLGREVAILDGMKPPRRRSLRQHQIVIVNYDILTPWLKYLQSLDARLLIIDEAHYISNMKTKRAKAVRKLGKGIPHIVALTGTPLTNRPKEIFSIANLIRPDIFPAFRAFADRYCRPRLTPWGWKFDGASHLDELHEILSKNLMIRRTKAHVLKDLPAKSRHIVTVEISSRKEYSAAHNDFVSWLRKKTGNTVSERAVHAQRLTRRSYLWRLAAELKLPSVFTWIDNFLAESDEKLVVFGVHHKILIPLYQRYKSTSVLINGQVTGKDRQRAIDKFQHDKRCRFLFGNYRAAGVGADYTAASTGISVELPWTPAEAIQAEDRLSRIGQKLPVNFFYLVAKGTIEERHCELLQRKQGDILDPVLDGKKKTSDFSIYEQLEQELIGRTH